MQSTSLRLDHRVAGRSRCSAALRLASGCMRIRGVTVARVRLGSDSRLSRTGSGGARSAESQRLSRSPPLGSSSRSRSTIFPSGRLDQDSTRRRCRRKGRRPCRCRSCWLSGVPARRLIALGAGIHRFTRDGPGRVHDSLREAEGAIRAGGRPGVRAATFASIRSNRSRCVHRERHRAELLLDFPPEDEGPLIEEHVAALTVDVAGRARSRSAHRRRRRWRTPSARPWTVCTGLAVVSMPASEDVLADVPVAARCWRRAGSAPSSSA